jgi:hypothetical protein
VSNEQNDMRVMKLLYPGSERYERFKRETSAVIQLVEGGFPALPIEYAHLPERPSKHDPAFCVMPEAVPAARALAGSGVLEKVRGVQQFAEALATVELSTAPDCSNYVQRDATTGSSGGFEQSISSPKARQMSLWLMPSASTGVPSGVGGPQMPPSAPSSLEEERSCGARVRTVSVPFSPCPGCRRRRDRRRRPPRRSCASEALPGSGISTSGESSRQIRT